jgi:hypothetical protein
MVSTNDNGFPLKGDGFPLQGNWFPLQGNWFPLQGVSSNAKLVYCKNS